MLVCLLFSVFFLAAYIGYLCGKKIIMSVLITSGFSQSKYFSATVPDLTFGIGGTAAAVVITLDGDEIYSERLFPVGGSISLRELGDLVRPYAKSRLVTEMKVSITEQDSNGNTLATNSASCTVVYCEADIDITADDWCDKHFLSLLMGAKVTALGRTERLHYTGTATASVTAMYADGSTKAFTATSDGGNSKYTVIDVSPSLFASAGNTLIGYTVTAGSRTQRFVIDFNNPDCAPILKFDNSFGCEEFLYCAGQATFSGEYKSDTTYIEGKNTAYKITETGKTKADTGPLSFAMAEWCRELFRSQKVYVVNFKEKVMQVGKQVIVSDPKVEYTNSDDEMPRITFSIQYAQKNHNVIQTGKDGRIFDNTFDFTFE